MIEATKGVSKYVFEKGYEHFLLFRAEDEDGKVLFRETFRNITEAQIGIREGIKIDWKELTGEIVPVEADSKKVNSVMGLKNGK